MPLQGRRRLLKSGPGMKQQRCFTSAKGTSLEGEHERGAGHERGHSPSRKGGLGDLPRENFIFPDVRRDNFYAFLDNFYP